MTAGLNGHVLTFIRVSFDRRYVHACKCWWTKQRNTCFGLCIDPSSHPRYIWVLCLISCALKLNLTKEGFCNPREHLTRPIRQWNGTSGQLPRTLHAEHRSHPGLLLIASGLKVPPLWCVHTRHDMVCMPSSLIACFLLMACLWMCMHKLFVNNSLSYSWATRCCCAV
jgi:hypothetical protein